MKKNIMIGIVFVLLSFSVIATDSAFKTSYNVNDKFEIQSTLTNDYNKGDFHVNKEIPFMYKLTSNDTLLHNFKGGLIKDNTYFPCFDINVTAVNPSIYGNCNMIVNKTGSYDFQVTYDNVETYTIENINVKNEKLEPYNIVLFGLAIIFLLASLIFKPSLIFGIIFLSSAIILTSVQYMYILGEIGVFLVVAGILLISGLFALILDILMKK